MKTPASILGHPLHPMLVPIAIGGFVLSLAADLLGLWSGNADPWRPLAYYTMLGGIAGALAAALPGLVDLLSLPQGAVRRTAIVHMALNLAVVALYAFNAWLRHGSTGSPPVMLSGVAILLLLASGWLGGKMVFEAGVGVGGRM